MIASTEYKNPVLCLMGTTATGKTDIAIELFEKFPLEIISVDSAMVYRGMDIGTAKPDEELLRQVPHHLIDILDPAESFSASDFCDSALTLIRDSHQRGKIPLLVGGTLLYFRSLLSGLSRLPPADAEIREAIETEAREKGWAAMHAQLAGFDPVSAEKIHPNDPQRLQRAIEVYRLEGIPLSVLQGSSVKTAFPWPVYKFALVTENRPWLHQRIADRFSTMLEQGFVEEVQGLYSRQNLHADLPSMRSVGYRQAWQFLQGKLTAAEMAEKAVIATRQLAKRQHTWLRTEPDLQIYDPEKMSRTHIISGLNSVIKRIDVL